MTNSGEERLFAVRTIPEQDPDWVGRVGLWRCVAWVFSGVLALVLFGVFGSEEFLRNRYVWVMGSIVALWLSWLMTGRAPWVWLAIGLLHFESVRLQLIYSVQVAALHFFNSYGERHDAVRSEILGNRED